MTGSSVSHRLLSALSVGGLLAAAALAGRVTKPEAGDAWTDGAAGAWLWVSVGLMPIVVAGVVAGRHRRPGGLIPLAVATAAVLATLAGQSVRLSEPPLSRRLLASIGAGLDVTAVVLAAAALGTLLRPRAARAAVPGALACGLLTAVVFGVAERPTVEAEVRPPVAALQLPSLAFFGGAGETLVLVLALAPVVAGGFLVWTLLGASIDQRQRIRWLALSLVSGIGVVAAAQLGRLLGLIEVGDGFLVALPLAVSWAAVMGGIAATVVQPDVGDAAVGVRRVAIGVGLATVLGTAGGLAWFAADATSGHMLPGAPAAAAILAIAALFTPIRERLEWVADRWLFGEVGSDARLIDGFGAAAEHAGRSEVLDLLVSTARRALRLRWARASTFDLVPAVAAIGVGAEEDPAPVASVALLESGEQLGLLECGPKRGGPFNAHDRQLLGALGREAALRLRTVSQAEQLAARLTEIERQAAEIAASRARIVEAQDEARRRIERDIHDGVQQDLASLVGKLRLALNQLERSAEDASTTIAGAQDDVRRALADVRAIAQGIHPAILDDQGIVPAIGARAKRLPLEVTIDVAPELSSRRFDRSLEGAAYFVASEAFANIVKHADASAVVVELSVDGDRLMMRICDDGRGLSDDVVRGSGLTNMADRAAALGGEVRLEANPGGGTTVVARLPLEPTVAM